MLTTNQLGPGIGLDRKVGGFVPMAHYNPTDFCSALPAGFHATVDTPSISNGEGHTQHRYAPSEQGWLQRSADSFPSQSELFRLCGNGVGPLLSLEFARPALALHVYWASRGMIGGQTSDPVW